MDDTQDAFILLGGMFMLGAAVVSGPTIALWDLLGAGDQKYLLLGSLCFTVTIAIVVVFFGRRAMWMKLLVHPGSREEYVLSTEAATFSAEREDTNAGTVVKVWDSAAEWDDWDTTPPAHVFSEQEATDLADTILEETDGETA